MCQGLSLVWSEHGLAKWVDTRVAARVTFLSGSVMHQPFGLSWPGLSPRSGGWEVGELYVCPSFLTMELAVP